MVAVGPMARKFPVGLETFAAQHVTRDLGPGHTIQVGIA